MGILIDLIIIGIIVLTAFVSYRYGFVRTLIEIVGFIAIMIFINAVSMPIAGGVYDKFIDKKIVEATQNVSLDTDNSGEKFWDSLPEFLKKENGVFSVQKEKIVGKFDEYIKNGIAGTASKTSKEVIKPIVVKPISLFVSLLLFLLLNPLLHFVAKLINGVIKKTFIRGINAKLGFIIGLPKGIIFAVAFVFFLLILVSIYPGGIWIFNKEAVDKSYIVGIISKYLPKTGMLKVLLKP